MIELNMFVCVLTHVYLEKSVMRLVPIKMIMFSFTQKREINIKEITVMKRMKRCLKKLLLNVSKARSV